MILMNILIKILNMAFIFMLHLLQRKDGPSAGCAFTSAVISRILGKRLEMM